MNKYQQALNRLICNISVTRSDYRKSGQANEDMDILQRLVDKATPRKFVKSYSQYGTETWLCPNCRRKLKREWQHRNNYCPKCGQKIEWSD